MHLGDVLPSIATLRILVAPTLAAFLSFVFVVIRPLSRLGGEYAFLVYTSLILFFFPGGRVIPQVEATALSVLGGTLGLGFSSGVLAIAGYCGRRYGADSDQSRVIVGIGLALLSLICGFLRSYSPRLIAASRIALFFPIFLLTANTSIVHLRASDFLDQFLVLLFAAAFGLISTMLLSNASSKTEFRRLLKVTMRDIGLLVPLSLSSVLQSEDENTDTASRQQTSSICLKASIRTLITLYETWSTEITRSRRSPASFGPIVKTLQHIQRNPLLGATSHTPGHRIRAALERTGDPFASESNIHQNHREIGLNDGTAIAHNSLRSRHFERGSYRSSRSRSKTSISSLRPSLVQSSDELTQAINTALSVSVQQLKQTGHEIDSMNPAAKAQSAYADSKFGLEVALSELQRRLAAMLDGLGGSTDSSASDRMVTAFGEQDLDNHLERDHFRLAFYMTALLDLAKDILGLMVLVKTVAEKALDNPRIHWPQVSWLVSLRFQKQVTPPLQAGQVDTVIRNEDTESDRAYEDRFATQEMDFVTATLYRAKDTSPRSNKLVDRVAYLWRNIWGAKRVVGARIAVSRLNHLLRHSQHILYSLKLAGGISLLSLAAFLPPNTPGRRWFERYRGAWAVISYMYVLDLHTGATFKVGFLRLCGTFIGALAGYICTLISHENPYALVALATTCSIPISYIILCTEHPPIGMVAGITLPPLLFLNYLDLAQDQSNFEIAWTRFVAITIGIAAAVLVGSMVWPNHARVRYFRAVSSTFDCETEYYLHMSRDLLRPSLVYQANTKQYDRLEGEVRRHLSASRVLVDLQRKEVSLLPRPIRLYTEVIDASERLIEAFCEVRVLRFSVPRKATVLDVLPIRRELVSSILITLWALSQAFQSRSSLPQYLPSPRIPLEGIMAIVDEHALKVARLRSGSRHIVIEDEDITGGEQDEMAILYGMAENEALLEVCTILEELVAAARTLFGTRTFLDQSHTHGLALLQEEV